MKFVLDNLNDDFTAAAQEGYSDYINLNYFMTCESTVNLWLCPRHCWRLARPAGIA